MAQPPWACKMDFLEILWVTEPQEKSGNFLKLLLEPLFTLAICPQNASSLHPPLLFEPGNEGFKILKYLK